MNTNSITFDGRSPRLPGSNTRLLVVEDNAADIDLFCESLSQRPIDLTVANTGEEALDRLNRRGRYSDATRPDLVVLDLNLPGLNGWEVMAEMRRTDDLRIIPVIILTSSKAQRDVKRSYDEGANCYLVKPNTLEDYRAVITSIESFWLDVAELPSHPIRNIANSRGEM